MKYTLAYKESKINKKFIGYILEIGGVITEGDSLEEIEVNIKNVLAKVLENHRHTELEPAKKTGFSIKNIEL